MTPLLVVLLAALVLVQGQTREGGSESRRLRKHLKHIGIPAVPYHVVSWPAAPGLDLLAVLGLEGSLTVLRVLQAEDGGASLSTVFHDDEAFPPAVVGGAVDPRKELIVLSAGDLDDERWVISRSSASVSDPVSESCPLGAGDAGS